MSAHIQHRVADPHGPLIRACHSAADPAEQLALQVELYNHRARLTAGVPTYLYVVDEPIAVKIGVAARPVPRVSNLQVGNPRPLTLICVVPAVLALEQLLHAWLADDLIQGEWFAKTPRVLSACSLLVSAAEQCDDMVEADYLPDPGDTLASITACFELTQATA